jgi:hypothetical protein
MSKSLFAVALAAMTLLPVAGAFAQKPDTPTSEPTTTPEPNAQNMNKKNKGHFEK